MSITVAAEDVRGWVKSTNPVDETHLVRVCSAATEYVNRYGRADIRSDAELLQAGIMLAARWYSRRNSVTGIQNFDSFGPTYVSRFDNDIQMMLGVNVPQLG